MKLVLVAGFSPSKNTVGPKVRLFAGRYRIATEHHKDSALVLRGGSVDISVEDGVEFVTKGGVFNLELHGGKEEFINVFAEYINGPQPSTT